MGCAHPSLFFFVAVRCGVDIISFNIYLIAFSRFETLGEKLRARVDKSRERALLRVAISLAKDMQLFSFRPLLV